MVKAKRAALYVRVSTDGQTVENQVRELRQIAERRGWEIVEAYSDAGISGSKGRDQRPGLDRMLNDASRRKFDLIATWAIDRLGRSLVDLLHTVQTLEACGVDLFIEQQNLDTTTPAGKLMFSVCGAFSEFERSMIRQRVKLGLKRAIANGKQLGRRPVEDAPGGAAKAKRARKLLAKGTGINRVAQAVKLSNGTVSRIAAAMR
jgi:DNA invertase Pin-like site-specific DNA recombinase